MDAPPSEQAAQLDSLNEQLASLSEQHQAQSLQLDSLRKELEARDQEIAVLRRQVSDGGPVVSVRSMEELDEKVRKQLDDTAAFLEEMEAFIRECDGDEHDEVDDE
jgi:DNA repair exonuclease SbcCD ATPase subunit